MSKISIVGWYGERNIGDEAFREVFMQEWGAKHDLIFSQRPDLSADHIVFGGGGVLCGEYLDTLPKNREAYAVGIDIAVNGKEWERLKEFNFKKIFIRSREYAAIAQDQGAAHIKYCPDLAFGLNCPAVRDGFSRELGVIVSSDLSQFSYLEMARALDKLSKIYKITFYSLYNGSKSPDSEIARYIIERMHTLETSQIVILKTPQKAIEAIAKLEYLITMRFHGAIFATHAGTPFVSLATPGKHSLFLEQECMKDAFVDIRDLTSYKLIAAVGNVMADRLSAIAHDNGMEVRRCLSTLLPSAAGETEPSVHDRGSNPGEVSVRE